MPAARVAFVSDFRSDTVTQPTDEMRRAMAAAVVGDDVLDGDPTVRELEEVVAQRLGKAGSLFVPSGTMANQVALGAWTRPGEEVIAERHAHLVEWESGGASANHGLQTLTLRAASGALPPDAVRESIRELSDHCPRTALVCVEQTYLGAGDAAGGRIVPLGDLRAVQAVAREARIPIHMDGARLFNAVVASGVPAAEWAACADSVSICLSKGLCAPVGSLIAGDGAFLDRARVIRKRLGGWMHQAGHLAAAGLVALEQQVERLAEDHALAREVAAVCDAAPGLTSPPTEVETNIVMVRVENPLDPEELVAQLAAAGVGALIFGGSLRLVTHKDVGPDDVERLRGALA